MIPDRLLLGVLAITVSTVLIRAEEPAARAVAEVSWGERQMPAAHRILNAGVVRQLSGAE
jgi:hypothetical protein